MHLLDKIKNQQKLKQYIQSVKALHEVCHFKKVRLTGGEPLLFQGIEYLIHELKEIGIPKITLTTNGVFLKEKAEALWMAGLKSINVSLDSLNQDTFFEITKRKNSQKVLDGIEEAKKIGFQIKLNTVVMKTVNEHEIIPLFLYAKERNIGIRYLEFMQMGYLREEFETYFFSSDLILKQLSQVAEFLPLEKEKNATANEWMTTDFYKFGIIANTTKPFCQDCDRLRLGSDMKLYGCLSNATGISVTPALLQNPEELQKSLALALSQKQKVAFTGSELSMKYIGG